MLAQLVSPLNTTRRPFLNPSDAAAQLAGDPGFTAWSDQRQIEDTAAFDAWLCSPAGQAWLESEAEGDLEARCLTEWEGF